VGNLSNLSSKGCVALQKRIPVWAIYGRRYAFENFWGVSSEYRGCASSCGGGAMRDIRKSIRARLNRRPRRFDESISFDDNDEFEADLSSMIGGGVGKDGNVAPNV
jgi:hypothetical protein